MTRRWLIVAAAAVLLSTACGDGEGAVDEPLPTTTVAPTSTTTSTTTVAPTSTTGGDAGARTECVAQPSETRTFVDDTRVTPATAQTAELASRSLDVWIDRPVTAVGVEVPLVIFAHGLTGHPRSHELHRRALAEDCFVVVAPAFPLTNNDVPGGFANAGDTPGQIGDVSFLIDQVLTDPDLGPLVDPERIGVIGHSLGGLTTAGVALSPDGDTRVSAAVVMSAGFGAARDDVAVMVLHGDADPLVPFATSEWSHDLLRERRLLVTLLGGDHNTGITDDESELGAAVRGLTGAFFVREFGDEPVLADRLDALPLELVEVDAATSEGPFDDWRDYFTS